VVLRRAACKCAFANTFYFRQRFVRRFIGDWLFLKDPDTGLKKTIHVVLHIFFLIRKSSPQNNDIKSTINCFDY